MLVRLGLLPALVSLGLAGLIAPASAAVSPGSPGGAGAQGAAAARTSPPAGTAAPAATAPPPGTVLRAGRFLTDAQGRVVVPRGMTIPAGVVPTPNDLNQWVEFGFTAARVEVPMTASGVFVPPGGQAGQRDSRDIGLETAAELVRMLTDRGFQVVLRIVPAAQSASSSSSSSATLPAGALADGLGRMAARFSGVGGLIGYEVAAAGSADLTGAVREHDAHHLLWQQTPAVFNPQARVAVNGEAGYLVGWGDGTPQMVKALTAAADTFTIGWFYDPPRGGAAGGAGAGAGQASALPMPPADTVRPYPAAVAGTPLDPGIQRDAAGTFRFSYSTARADGGSFDPGTPTAIVLPAWSFPAGYQVQVTGARVTSPAGSGVLCLVAEPGAAQVTVQIARAAGGAVTAPQVAGAGNCASPGASSGAAAGQGAGVAAGEPAGEAAGGSDSGDDADSPILLVVLPLLGAAMMAAVLGPVFLKLRRFSHTRRQSRGDGDRAGAGAGPAAEAPAPGGNGAPDRPETGENRDEDRELAELKALREALDATRR